MAKIRFRCGFPVSRVQESQAGIRLSRCSKGLQEEVTHRQRKDDVTRFRFGCLTELHTIGGESLDHLPGAGVVPEGSQQPLLNALPIRR